MMQVLCMTTSADTCDVECPVCHQRYAVYYSRHDKTECEEALEQVLEALLEHHALAQDTAAHPLDAFNVPAWNGPAFASAAALLSGAPVPRPLQPRPAKLTLLPGAQQRRVS